MPRKPKRAAPGAGAGAKQSPGAKKAPEATTNPAAKWAPAAKVSPAAKGGPGSTRAPGSRGDLSRVQVEAIREFALDLARKGAGPDTVLICNPISEPSALPAKELLYDRCRWCETDVYYDRLMPTPPGLMRVCLKCGILLLEAEKKGAN